MARRLLSCSKQTLSCGMHVGSSSPTRDQTQAPSIGSVESYPMDHQESPPSPRLYPSLPTRLFLQITSRPTLSLKPQSIPFCIPIVLFTMLFCHITSLLIEQNQYSGHCLPCTPSLSHTPQVPSTRQEYIFIICIPQDLYFTMLTTYSVAQEMFVELISFHSP